MAVSKNSLKGTLCVLAAGMCWGTTGTIQAFAPEGASSLTVGSARVVFSGVVLMLFMLARRGRGLFAGGWNLRGVLLAAAGLAAYQLTFFTAVRMTGVAVGTMVAIGAAPPVAGICGRLFFRERLSPRWYAATALSVAGCVMLVAGGNSGALEVSVLGVFLAFCAALSFALEGVGLRMIERDAYETIAMVSGISALMALPWLVAGDAAWMLTPRGALCMALLTFLSTVVPYTLFTIGVQNVELGVVYTLGLAEPLTAWFLSTVLLGERLSLIGSAGVAVLFSGILLLALSKKNE